MPTGHTTLDTSSAPFWKWFVGGRLNASFNCVDRHLARSRNKAALISVPEPEAEEAKAITLIDHKAKADEAVAKAHDLDCEIDKVLVWRRHPGQYASKSPMIAGRDFFVDELLGDCRGRVVEPVSMPAEASVTWNYTTSLNIAFLVLSAFLVVRFLRTGGPEMLRMMGRPPEEHPADAEAPVHHNHDDAATYVCPMHPEATSEHPGRCSKCGMPLERR